MSEHTTSHWRSRIAPTQIPPFKDYEVVDGNDSVIAVVFTEANARVSAAAPELLEALEDCVDSLEYVERNMPGATGYGVRQERITKARSVISKAKGG